uniref:Uncharacterized protein n=1 Tax=Pieris brassicae granulosis virus TaxID=10465 RepID=A0A7G9U8Q7_GVPB|nr:hypothetical protein [Pieris brassicae granulovirus]
MTVNTGLMEANRNTEVARRESTILCNRMADITQNVITQRFSRNRNLKRKVNWVLFNEKHQIYNQSEDSD